MKKILSFIVWRDSAGFSWNMKFVFLSLGLLITLSLVMKTWKLWNQDSSSLVTVESPSSRAENTKKKGGGQKTLSFDVTESKSNSISELTSSSSNTSSPKRGLTSSKQPLALSGRQVFANTDQLASGREDRYLGRLESGVDSRAQSYPAKFRVLKALTKNPSLRRGDLVVANHRPVGKRLLFEIVSHSTKGGSSQLKGYILDGRSKLPGLEASYHSNFLSKSGAGLGLAAVAGSASYFRERSLMNEESKPSYQNTMRGVLSSAATESAGEAGREYLRADPSDAPYLTLAPGAYAELVVSLEE